MGVSKNRGTTKWMVKIMENPIKIGDLGGTTIFGNIPVYANIYRGIPWPPFLKLGYKTATSFVGVHHNPKGITIFQMVIDFQVLYIYKHD